MGIFDIKKRFNEIASYNPKFGILNEGFNDVDTSGYICIGEVYYYPWADDGDRVFIMVNPEKTMLYGKMINDVRYTENSDGTGKQTQSIPTNAKNNLVIYQEYRDTEFGEMFLGKRKSNDEVKQKHQEFLSKLFIIDNNVLLHHNSSFEIRDGIIKKGVANGWSNNGDIGIYFWGSRNSGNDPSNNSHYTYYCLIPIEDLYDFETNVDRISLDQALKKYKYAGQYWKKGDAIVVSTLQSTPIYCILDKQNGKWYDKKWNKIEKPF